MINFKKEKPIMFSTMMVKAILNGEKTQTRRILKLKKGDTVGKIYGGNDELVEWIICDKDGDEVPLEFVGRYGGIGDILWVKETWQYYDQNNSISDSRIIYKADFAFDNSDKLKWRSAMFMPKFASRIKLEIIDKRIQKLRQISENDAKAEGVKLDFGIKNLQQVPALWQSYKQAYFKLWDSINGKWSSNENDFVIALTFKRMPR